jgi:hypothetical protein
MVRERLDAKSKAAKEAPSFQIKETARDSGAELPEQSIWIGTRPIWISDSEDKKRFKSQSWEP